MFFPNDCLDLYDVDVLRKCKHFVKYACFKVFFNCLLLLFLHFFVILSSVNRIC